MSDEELVRSLDDQERAAALKRNVAALERLWSDQFTVNAPNNEVVIGKRAVLETFVHTGVINWLGSEMMSPSPRPHRTVRTRHRVHGSSHRRTPRGALVL